MSYTSAVSRVAQIQSELAALRTALDSTKDSSASFAEALAQAQAAGSPQSSAPSAVAASVAGAPSTGASNLGATGSPTQGGSLPSGAQSMLSSDQKQFASRLAQDTGLSSGVVAAWLLAEESGGAAQSRQAANNNDWLNIGYTDSGTYGSGDSVWSNPVTAADATAGWLKGQNTIPGYGTASSGVQGILATASQSPEAQISAIQNSGWASSGYPDLPGLYQQVAG
jgi:hypothetical protein